MKARLVTLILAGLIASACAKRIERSREDLGNIRREISCEKFGFCFAPGLNAQGKLDYAFRVSSECPGKQLALVHQERVTYVYKGHLDEPFDVIEETIVERIGECK